MPDYISKKFDDKKPMVAYVPPKALLEVARVFTYGAKKYGAFNYAQTGFAATRLVSAAYRHLLAYQSGEIFDKESGQHHVAHAISNLMMLLEDEQYDFPKKDKR